MITSFKFLIKIFLNELTIFFDKKLKLEIFTKKKSKPLKILGKFENKKLSQLKILKILFPFTFTKTKLG